MKVLTSDQQQVIDRLLQYAGSASVLEEAFRRVQGATVDQATLEALLKAILEVKREHSRPQPQPEPTPA